MIPIAPPPEPPNFEAACGRRGRTWLAKHPPGGSEPLPNYWRHFLPELCDGFHRRCAYLAMLDMNGTVDHFLSTSAPASRHLAYEWSNYRYATGWLNSSKQALDQECLDPFEVREEWFEVDLASLHLRITPALPRRLSRRVSDMIRRLGLDYGRRTLKNRRFYYRSFLTSEFTLGYLEQVAPLIATAVRREQLLTHLLANPPVSRQDIANICATNIVRASELAIVWRLAGHLRAVGRGRNVRYRRV